MIFSSLYHKQTHIHTPHISKNIGYRFSYRKGHNSNVRIAYFRSSIISMKMIHFLFFNISSFSSFLPFPLPSSLSLKLLFSILQLSIAKSYDWLTKCMNEWMNECLTHFSIFGIHSVQSILFLTEFKHHYYDTEFVLLLYGNAINHTITIIPDCIACKWWQNELYSFFH